MQIVRQVLTWITILSIGASPLIQVQQTIPHLTYIAIKNDNDYCYSSIVCIITICISIDPIDNTIACIIMYCKIRIETNVNWE